MATDILWNQSLLSGIPARTPHSVLQEQARLVKELTKSQLTASVRVVGYKRQGATQVNLTLQLLTPAFPDYALNVLTVVHDQDAIYPCEVVSDETVNQYGEHESAASEAELRTILRRVLNSPRVNAAVTSISARVFEKEQGVSPPVPQELIVIDDQCDTNLATPPSGSSDVPF
jgi:hypothetical protein